MSVGDMQMLCHFTQGSRASMDFVIGAWVHAILLIILSRELPGI